MLLIIELVQQNILFPGITGSSAIHSKHLEKTEITTRNDTALPETVARRRIKSSTTTKIGETAKNGETAKIGETTKKVATTAKNT